MDVALDSKPGRGFSPGLMALALALAFLDLWFPPWGIPLALVAIAIGWRWQERGASELGIRRPESWSRLAAIALGGASLMLALGELVYPALLNVFGLAGQDLTWYQLIEGNHAMLGIYLGVAWTTAGFGEELVFRGLLMIGLAESFGRGRGALLGGLLLSSVLFGFLFVGTGAGAVLTTVLNGSILAGVFLAAGRNLWAA